MVRRPLSPKRRHALQERHSAPGSIYSDQRTGGHVREALDAAGLPSWSPEADAWWHRMIAPADDSPAALTECIARTRVMVEALEELARAYLRQFTPAFVASHVEDIWPLIPGDERQREAFIGELLRKTPAPIVELAVGYPKDAPSEGRKTAANQTVHPTPHHEHEGEQEGKQHAKESGWGSL